MTRSTADDGFALPAMLAFLLALSLVVAAALSLARGAHDKAVETEARTRSYYAAEGGIALAVDALSEALATSTPAPTKLTQQIGDSEVTVALVDERALLDVNFAPEPALSNVLTEAGVMAGVAQAAARAIIAHRTQTPLRSPFEGAELVEDAAARCALSRLSVHSGRRAPLVEPSGPFRPEFGAPVRIIASVVLDEARLATVQAVLRLSGNPANPILVHEWRRVVTLKANACLPSPARA